jgi:hypothetical protein
VALAVNFGQNRHKNIPTFNENFHLEDMEKIHNFNVKMNIKFGNDQKKFNFISKTG